MAQNSGDASMKLTITDYRYLRSELRKIEPQLVSEMRQEIRAIGRPAQLELKRELRSTRYPLGARKDPRRGGRKSGFDHSGRLAWDKSARALNVGRNNYLTDSVFVQADVRRKRGKGYHILRLRANSAVAGLIDMTGRVGKYRDGALSREHQINLFGKGVITRRYRINGQGRALAARLTNKFGSASRILYPALEKSKDGMVSQVDAVISKAVSRINSKLR